MSNRGGIDSAITDALEQDNQQIFVAIKAEFDTETIHFWTGEDTITFGGSTYEGAGSLLNISNIDDTMELKSTNITISLAGMNETVLNLALSESYQNRNITVFMGYLMGGTREVMGTLVLFKGRMQKMSIFDNPQGSTIQLEAENRLIDLERPSNLRFTKESQKYIDSTDTSFNLVASLQDKEIVWGKASSTGGGSTGGGSSGGMNRHMVRR